MNVPVSSRPWWTGVVLSSFAGAICICIATYATWRILGRPMVGIDDANIFFIYARNFAHGHGIVYNIGGEHVEGFTSMLYFLLCSLGYLLSPAPETALFWMNLLFTVLTSACLLYVLHQLADLLNLGRGGKLLLCGSYLLWLVANPAYFAWNVVTLMDSGVYSLLLTAGYAFVASLLLRGTQITRRHAIQLGVLCSLCILARPEGLGWAVIQVSAFACICWAQTRSARTALRLTSIPLAALLVTIAALTGFREVYFGYPLPNTFYAKVSSSLSDTLGSGSWGLKLFLRLYGIFFALPLCMGVVWILYALVRGKQRDRLFWFSALTALFTVVGLAMPVMEGGDHFNACRMFQNVYPLFGISLFLPLLPFTRARKLSFDAVYLLFIGLLIALTSHATWRAFRIANQSDAINLPQRAIERQLDMYLDFSIAEGGRVAGERMDRIFNGGLPSIGIAAAGGTAYTYHGTVYDLVGLNESRMAHADAVKVGPQDHASFNAGIFYELAPDILQPLAIPSGDVVDLQARKIDNLDPGNFDNQIYKDIFHQDRFRSMYILALVRNPADPKEMVYGYFRKTYLDELTTKRGFEVIRSVAL
jgi:hypothetical protein